MTFSTPPKRTSSWSLDSPPLTPPKCRKHVMDAGEFSTIPMFLPVSGSLLANEDINSHRDCQALKRPCFDNVPPPLFVSLKKRPVFAITNRTCMTSKCFKYALEENNEVLANFPPLPFPFLPEYTEISDASAANMSGELDDSSNENSPDECESPEQDHSEKITLSSKSNSKKGTYPSASALRSLETKSLPLFPRNGMMHGYYKRKIVNSQCA